MIRTTNDCAMSNAERAVYANESGAEIFVRIHANSSKDPSVNGAMFYAPSSANSYLSADVISASIYSKHTKDSQENRKLYDVRVSKMNHHRERWYCFY